MPSEVAKTATFLILSICQSIVDAIHDLFDIFAEGCCEKIYKVKSHEYSEIGMVKSLNGMKTR